MSYSQKDLNEMSNAFSMKIGILQASNHSKYEDSTNNVSLSSDLKKKKKKKENQESEKK
jgi:hypothetical protein